MTEILFFLLNTVNISSVCTDQYPQTLSIIFLHYIYNFLTVPQMSVESVEMKLLMSHQCMHGHGATITH